jgi:peptide deformylase
MALLPIVTLPDESLRRRSKEVDPGIVADPAFQRWLDDLVATMWKADGIGIAAPQVGRPVRVFVAVDKDTPHIVINPVVVAKSWRMEDGEEGCLSVPGKFGTVRRHRKFKVRGLDRHGKPVVLAGEGFFARVLQHETDHLNGTLFIDKARNIIEAER